MNAISAASFARTVIRVTVIPLLVLIVFSPVVRHSAPPLAQIRIEETSSWQRSNSSRAIERQKLETLIVAAQNFTAAGADLTKVKDAITAAKAVMFLPYAFPAVRVTPNYIAAGIAITAAETGATAEATAIAAEAARVEAARVEAARVETERVAAEVSARSSRPAAAVRRTPVTSAGPATPSRYVIHVAGVASNQAGIDAGGIRDITAWMAQGKPELAAHWTSGGGSRVPRGAGQLFTVVGAGALDGDYISSGIVAYLNVNTQDASAIPGGYALLFTSCYFNDSSHEEIIGMQRG
jgi:hypothetical protein